MNESLESSPVFLTEEKKQDYYNVIEDFFSNFHLQDINEELWDWLVAALSSDCSIYNSGHARSNLIYVFEKIVKLLEATSEINRRRKKKRRRKHRKQLATV